MQRRNFIHLTGGGVIAAATLSPLGLSGCTAGMPPEAIEAWRGPAEPAGADLRRWLLSYAILAPHSHNLQSWIVDLSTPDEILLRCDLKRLLPQTDPLSRQIMMSHGSFLELLDLAARERGLRADFSLFPEGAFGPTQLDTRPVARVRLTPDPAVQKDPLFTQVLLRHTNRNSYDLSRPVPASAWQAMADATKPQAVRFGQVRAEQTELLAAHRKIATEAWRIELTTPRTVMESFDVLRVGANEIAQHRDGLSLLDAKVIWLDRLGLFDRSKAPAPDDFATTSQISEFGQKIESTAGFLWMVTDGNDRVTQVNAGRAYARVQLAATAQGLGMQPLSQALQEYPEQQKPYEQIHALVGAMRPAQTVQMWARVGYAPAAPPAPRRRLQDFIRA
jgi:nitroreductase